MIDEAYIRSVLNTVIDPCSVAAGVPAGLDEMGLVRSLQVNNDEQGASVKVLIGVTEPWCPMGGAFVTQARHVLEELDGVARVEVGMDYTVDWEPEKMAPAYRARLEAHRAVVRKTLNIIPVTSRMTGQ